MVSVIVMATGLVLHAAYFDWSDLGMHVFVAVVCLAAWIRWPTAAVGAIGLFCLPIVIFWTAGRFMLWDPGVRVGEPYSAAEARLGQPTVRASTLAEARERISGYAEPSPLLYRRAGPVSVFADGEFAVWIFHDGRTIKAVYVGGS